MDTQQRMGTIMQYTPQRYTYQELRDAYIRATLDDVVVTDAAVVKIAKLPSIPLEIHTVPEPVNGRVLCAISVYRGTSC